MVNFLNNQQREVTFFRKQGNNVPDENTVEGYEMQEPTNPILINESQMYMPIPAAEVVANPLLAPTEAAVEYEFK